MPSIPEYLRALLIGTLCAQAALAQDRIIIAPRAIAQQFLDAIAKEQWTTLLELTDGETLWEYATQLRQQSRNSSASPRTAPTIQSFMAEDSLMPRAVAEYMLSQYTRSAEWAEMSPLRWMLADVERPEQLDSLSDGELFVRRVRAGQIGYMVRLAHQSSGCKTPTPRVPDATRIVRGVALPYEFEAVALYDQKNGWSDREGELLQLKLRRTSQGWRVAAE